MHSLPLSLFSFGLAITSALTAPTSSTLGSPVKRDNSGTATFYGGNVGGGTCSFSDYTLPPGLYGTALSDSNWNSSANCGGCVTVTGPSGNQLTAMIVDKCPGCGENHLDLFPDAFAKLSNPDAGVINIDWVYTPCTQVSGPLQIHIKSGASQYWFSAQVVNGKDRTSTMEVSSDNGATWQPTQRQDYNFFQSSGGTGSPTCSIRVTSEAGKQIVVPNVQIVGDARVNAPSNY